MKNKILLLAIPCLIIIGFYWTMNHGFIEVTIEAENQDISYTLFNQAAQKSSEFKARSTIKKLVRKGTYELIAKQGDSSSFSAIKTKGFLGSSKISTKLMPENSRKFIGNNPSPCMKYVSQVLLSYGCNDVFSNTLVHMPATATQPTYSQKIPASFADSIEGTIKTKEGQFVLLRASYTDEEQASPHTLYRLMPTGEVTDGINLGDLGAEEEYTLREFDEGFLAINTALTKPYYYSSATAKASPISMVAPKGKNLIPYTFSTLGKNLAVAYTDKGYEEHNFDEEEADKIASEVVIQNGNATGRYRFKKTYRTVTLCADNILCLLSGINLEVYDISASKQRLLYAVSGVNSFEITSSSLVAVRDKETLNLNAKNGQGYISYEFGSYEACGLQTDDSNYILCLINPRKDKVALYIDQSKNTTDNIDKKIAELLQLKEVSNISVYDHSIFISPELGEPVYREDIESFGYDQVIKNNVNNKIRQEIDRLGIDRKIYSIINAFD